MNWFRTYRKAGLLVGMTVAVPLLLVIYLLASLWMTRLEYQAEIDRFEPRIARLKGLLESEKRLKKSTGKVGTQILDMVYPASQDAASVSADLQKNVRSIMTEAGLTVTVSRVLPVVEDEKFDRIGVSLSVNGSIEALDTALTSIAAYTPLLLVVSMDAKPVPASRTKDTQNKQAVNASLQLLTLRAAI